MIATIFKCPGQWHEVFLCCCETDLQNFTIMRVQNFTPIQHQIPLLLPQLLAPTILLSIIFLLFLLSISVNLTTKNAMGFPSCTSGKEATCQCKRRKKQGFNPWVGKIPLEEGIATRSRFLAWRIPWTEEPGRLWFIGSQRVEHDWSNLACTGKNAVTAESHTVCLWLTYFHLAKCPQASSNLYHETASLTF